MKTAAQSILLFLVVLQYQKGFSQQTEKWKSDVSLGIHAQPFLLASNQKGSNGSLNAYHFYNQSHSYFSGGAEAGMGIRKKNMALRFSLGLEVSSWQEGFWLKSIPGADGNGSYTLDSLFPASENKPGQTDPPHFEINRHLVNVPIQLSAEKYVKRFRFRAGAGISIQKYVYLGQRFVTGNVPYGYFVSPQGDSILSPALLAYSNPNDLLHTLSLTGVCGVEAAYQLSKSGGLFLTAGIKSYFRFSPPAESDDFQFVFHRFVNFQSGPVIGYNQWTEKLNRLVLTVGLSMNLPLVKQKSHPEKSIL